MSHELRTPLNIILGYAQLLSSDTSLTPEYQTYLQSIHRSGNHLLALINDVLDLAKIEAGRFTLDATPFNLPDFILTLQSMFQIRADAKGLSLHVELGDVPTFISTDLNKLRQILVNLLSNAVKFTHSGAVTLRVNPVAEALEGKSQPRETVSTPQSFLQFEVEDTGVGIAPEELEAIFEAFVQATAGRLSTEGTGLGLTISLKYAELMGGRLTASSTPEEGSCFRLWIPVTAVALPSDRALPVTRPVVRLLPGQPPYRILVVDDQPASRQLLGLWLRRVGLEVQEVGSGAEAVATWQSWQPDLIWMDLRMAGMTGAEAMQKIRQLEAAAAQPCPSDSSPSPTGKVPRCPLPIIALTAQAYQEDRDRAIASGFTDLVTKPFDAADIFQKMALSLGLQYEYGAELVTSDTINPVNLMGQRSLCSEALQVMPPPWIADLSAAALNCSSQEVEAIIAQIPPQHHELIRGLKNLLHHYEFETILKLCQT